MGEFAQLNYIVVVVLSLAFGYLITRIKRWVMYRWWTFGLVQLFTTIVLLHPILLVLVYWQLIMDNQRIFPYPYTMHDQISFWLYLLASLGCFYTLFHMQVIRVLRRWRKHTTTKKL